MAIRSVKTDGRSDGKSLRQYADTFRFILREYGRTKAKISLQHLSALALIATSTEVAQVLRLHAEIATLVTQISESRSEVDQLRTEIGVLRRSYSFRVGSALFGSLRWLRSRVTART